MSGVDPTDVQAALCAVLVDEWARAGVTDAVVAPGSRSTPMVLALDRDERLRKHVVLDERAAGFMALGLGLASGHPAIVATTSGTAAVELHPAVVEASHAGVPLIAVTADRPPELHGVGAPQTVDQDGLFGTSPRWAVSPGVAERDARHSWRSLAARLVAESVAGPNGPGPVHLNLAFREPLLGIPAEADMSPGRPDGGPWHERMPSKGAQPQPSVIDLLAGYAGGRGLIVAGAGAGEPATLTAAANHLGWPLMAEPRSGCRGSGQSVVACADALLRLPEVAAWRPDVVLRLGAPWVSRVLTQWLASLGPQTLQVLVDPWGRWADPDRQVRQVVASDPTAVVEALLAATGGAVSLPPTVSLSPAAFSSWARQWLVAERRAQAVLDSELGAAGPLAMSEPGVARAVLAGVPDGTQVVVSSSMPIRDIEWYSAPRDGVAVLSNRGSNGIDGVLSTATGAALGTGAPTVALVGDLAFLYDAGALLGSAGRDVALTIVVVDNDGGGIFSFLPQAATLPAGQFERYWGTPHGVDIATLAAAYGVEVTRLHGPGALVGVLADAARPGVRVAVVRTDRQDNVGDHDRLHRAIADAVCGPDGRG
jgi:2-succinyl-5-enolpyruvyl-6-hydroxy-3-cyclohexene-1-carboxylate synthase